MTFNEFLASEEGRRRVNNEQADLLMADFKRHGVTIRTYWDFHNFKKEHPEYFHIMTEEEKRNGLQSLEMMWWEYWRLENIVPLRSVNPRYFRR